MKNATVLFDLDGTMVDSAPDLIKATNFTLQQYGWEPVAGDIIRPAISVGAVSMIMAGLGAHGAKPGTEQIEQMRDVFLDYYVKHLSVESRAFPGFLEAAKTLRAEGARLGVCTNKREDLALHLLRELQLDELFEAVTGRDTFAVCKPHPGHLLGALEMMGGDPERAVMVGDSVPDAEAARSAKMPFVGVSFGYEADAARLEADVIIDHYSELAPALRRVFR
ncbi:MAG: HAD-IA family hydrolase [Alphaproteobacteria bacterium]